jgi:hypothetical protein
MKKPVLIFIWAILAVIVAGCSTAEKPVAYADLHPAKPGHRTYDSARNMTLFEYEGWSMAVGGNATNVMFYPEGTPLQISPKRFESLYQLGRPQVAVATEYLGQKDGYAYLRITSIPVDHPKKASSKIVYVPLADLAPSFRETLPVKGSAR